MVSFWDVPPDEVWICLWLCPFTYHFPVKKKKKECKILDVSFRIILIQEENDVFTNITIQKIQAECLSDFKILLNINSPTVSRVAR